MSVKLQMELRRNSINLSTYLNKMREYDALSGKATFWFGGILSLIEENYKGQPHDDLNTAQKVEIIKIISKALSSISNFYEQERPSSVYKLLNLMEWLMEQWQGNKQYGLVISRVNYLNILSIYAIKTRQYAYAINIYNEMLHIYSSRIIDNTNEFFLAFLNNYLTFLRKTNKKMTSKMLEVENILKEIFIKFFTKVMVFDRVTNQQNAMSCISLLAAVYKQNQTLFTKYQKDVNSLILHSFQPMLKAKKKIPENMIEYVFKQKIKKHIYFNISFSEEQIKFYSAHKARATQSLVMKKHQEEQQPEKKLTKIEAMLEQSIELLNQQKIASARYNTLQKNQSVRLNESMDFNTIQTSQTITNRALLDSPELKTLQTLQPLPLPLPRSYTRKKQTQLNKTKAIQKMVRFKTIIFKIRSIFIEINEDGILLSDYTKENKRYIEWNTLSLILQRIDLHFPFEELLKIPLQNYYDFVRIISFYLTKNDNKEICLLGKPLPLLQINQMIKFYKQEGKYLKLALMNRYDPQKFIGVIDCYFSEFSQFFKYLNQNEYLGVLNQKIAKGNSNWQERQQSTYLIDYIKRKRQTTVAELGHQLQCQHLEYAMQERNTLYKCLFILKNNLQIYLKIVDNIKSAASFEDYVIEVKIDNVNTIGNQTFYLSEQPNNSANTNTLKISKTIEIPIAKLTHYFPPYNASLKEYICLYSRTIVDMLNYFDEHSKEINLGALSFEVKIHACRTQMIQYGKYFSVVSAQVIGSKQRVWGMIVRFYDLAYCTSKITVMMNPYHQFLQCLIGCGQQERQEIMKHLLVNQSVRDTYNWLKKAGKVEKRINLFEYLYANQLI